MFWRKKSKVPPPLGGQPATTPPPLRSDLSHEFKQDLLKELETAGRDTAEDVLSGGIGLIKTGARELLPGWIREFGKADVFVVSVEQGNPQTAFVFGPKDDRNYVAVFTRLELAQDCLRQFPALRFAMRLKGIDLLELARDAKRGIWVNPMNDACSVRFPADLMGRFLGEARKGIKP